MLVPEIPKNEQERLAALNRYRVMDTEAEQSFDDLTELASAICNTPIALISLIDGDRQWFKSRVGLDAKETSRDIAFCAHAIHYREAFIVPDASKDDRFHDNPLVTGGPEIRFYAGAPLVTPDGYALGTLCAIDDKPRELDSYQIAALEALSRQVVAQLELRYRNAELYSMNVAKTKLFSVLAHDLRSPFSAICGFSKLLMRKIESLDHLEAREFAGHINTAANSAYTLVDNLLQWAANEIGATPNEPRHLGVAEAVQQVAQIVDGSMRHKDITLQSEIDATLIVTVDEDMFRSVLLNLVSNAIKFSEHGAEITVRAEPSDEDDGNARISVIDQGVGISASRQSALFTISGTESTHGTEGEAGSGLGLPLCAEYVGRMGGSIRADSVEGEGSTFSFTVPLT